MAGRAYDSPLRAEQAEMTREKILEALCEQLNEAREDFSISRVAKRAGVSVRTVYHYFPNREAQIEALATWIDTRFTPPNHLELPTRIEDLPAYTVARSEYLTEAHIDLMRITASPGLAQKIRAIRRRNRDKIIEECVAKEDVPADAVAILAGLFKYIIGVHMLVRVHDTTKLNLEQSIRGCQWLVEIIVKAIQDGDYPTLD
ncbi:MAG: TetR/AcrR family transcriptional regulator [Candidatus Sericytochromatia bacterium]|nr:TetR/AcrR family transcriptional regulator [Candidatus Sericytochromatia bacterium]